MKTLTLLLLLTTACRVNPPGWVHTGDNWYYAPRADGYVFAQIQQANGSPFYAFTLGYCPHHDVSVRDKMPFVSLRTAQAAVESWWRP